MAFSNNPPVTSTSKPHEAQLSMIPVYLRSGETSLASSTRRASLPAASQKQSGESTPKRVSHDLSGLHSVNNMRAPSAFRDTSNQNEPPISNNGKQTFASKPDPRRILANLERLSQPGLNIYDLLNIHRLLAIHERDLSDIAEREDWIKGKCQADELKTAVFGLSLREAAMYASTNALFNGHELHLPLVVFDCVEELYRTGIYKQDLFRVLPNRQRLAELIHIFNSPNPHVTYRSRNRRSKVAEYNTTLLHPESTQDICALLINYLCSLPEPILPTYLFDAIWEWGGVCGDAEDRTLEVGGDAESFIKENQRRSGPLPPPKSRPEESSEATRISIVQHILCLLPSPNFSLLVYLLAFFSHVVMMRDVNGVDVQELGRLFGKCVFGGEYASLKSSPSRGYDSERQNGQTMMCWFLKRWGPISNGLFDVVSVRAGQGRPPVVMGGRVKPKSPINLNSIPSPTAWLSTKKRSNVGWSMTLLSPKVLSSFAATLWSPSSQHLSPPTFPSDISELRGKEEEILNGPSIARKNVYGDRADEHKTEVAEKPGLIPAVKRQALQRMPTVTSICSSADINERLLDVSFSPLLNDLSLLDAIPPKESTRSVASVPNQPVENKIMQNAYPELSQAHDRIRELEHRLDKNDTLVGEALEMMFRAKRRVGEIDDRLKELEVALKATAENRKAHEIVVELRKLMSGEL